MAKCSRFFGSLSTWASRSFRRRARRFGQEVPIDRTVLPIRQPTYPPVTELDARNVKPPPFFQVKAPAGAPNVLIVLIDDMGFGQSSAFGGPVHMPTVEALANDGLRFNEFHTTALCSPTRTALLTGRNHHMANMGSITETATAFQGNDGRAARQRRAARGNAAPQWLRHRRLRQISTRRRPGNSAPPARPTAGRPAQASTNSTASSAARPISGRRRFRTA